MKNRSPKKKNSREKSLEESGQKKRPWKKVLGIKFPVKVPEKVFAVEGIPEKSIEGS